MKVISMISKEKKNAGAKAPKDIDVILKESYNAKIMHYSRSLVDEIKIVFDFILFNLCKDYIVVQAPFIYKSFLYNFLPKKRTIILIHDISGLRNGKKDMLEKEISILKKFKYIIVHNDKMKTFLIQKGIKKENLYKLEIFDYLIKKNNQVEKNKTSNKLEIVYAGNLKKAKSPFVYQLDEDKMKFQINLYGNGNEKINNKKIFYKGTFQSDNPLTISGKLGLVWDGNYDDSDANELFKNYTRYNNPHKLSCYLAVGLPVIVWSKSAISEIVEKYNIGYQIGNLYDINNIDLSDYDEKKKNVEKLSTKLRDGFFTKEVMRKIIE